MSINWGKNQCETGLCIINIYIKNMVFTIDRSSEITVQPLNTCDLGSNMEVIMDIGPIPPQGWYWSEVISAVYRYDWLWSMVMHYQLSSLVHFTLCNVVTLCNVHCFTYFPSTDWTLIKKFITTFVSLFFTWIYDNFQ